MRTEIGHFSISYDQDYELYPTFKNMRKICEPSEMPAFFAGLFGAKIHDAISIADQLNSVIIESVHKKIVYSDIHRVYEDAAFVIQCCCDADVGKLTGFSSYASGRKAWRKGVMIGEDMLTIARQLMIHGVTGTLKSRGSSKGKASDTIDVYNYVEMAMAHLNMSYAEAEQLTKTEFDRLIDAKYPEAKAKRDLPSVDDHKKNIEILKEINARREANKGSN